MTRDQAHSVRQSIDPGIGCGFGWAIVTDPTAAEALVKGHLSLGRRLWTQLVRGSGKALTVVALTNTAIESMWGQFTVDLRNAIYAAI